ncbi:MAG: glycosyltransferase family 39 protein [Chloroflexi bacterium]|nr:glycosyltransferase family 39 protein [Chloroflexota bacterium]
MESKARGVAPNLAGLEQSKKISRAQEKSAVAWLKLHQSGVVLALVVLTGAAMRLFVLGKAHFIGDGDEALIGLMAMHITQGQFPVFTYGLPYMGATESYFIAPLYLLFGISEVGMKIAPWLASSSLIILNYVVARRFFDSPLAGLLAATLTAFPPLYLTITGLRAWGNFIETLLLGDLLFLLAYHLVFTDHRNHKWKIWGLFGLAVGYSFYGYWLAAFYYLPIFFFIFLKDKLFFLRRPFLLFIGAFFVGSLPFWIWNVFNNWATYHFFFDPPKGNTGGGKPPALDVLNFFLTTSLRLAVGSFNYWFPVGTAFALILHTIYGLTLIGWLVARWRGMVDWFRLSLKAARPVDMLLLFVLLSPLLYLVSGVGTNAFALPGVDTTGRYLLPLMGVAPLLLGGGLATLASKEWKLKAKLWKEASPKLGNRNLGKLLQFGLIGIGLALVLFCNLYPYRRADFVWAFQSPYYMNLKPPVDNRPVIAYLKQEGIEYLTCNHWVGNRLMLSAADAVKCVDYYDLQQGGLERFPHLTATLLEPGRQVGFLLINPGGERLPLEERLTELGVTFTRRDFTPYSVIIPRSRTVSPPEVLEALRYPY